MDADSGMAGRMGEASRAIWNLREFLLLFIMWAVMMVGMMVPTAVRGVLIYSAVANRTADPRALASTCYFVAGYVLVWTGFSLAATVLQMGLGTWGLISSMGTSNSYLGAAFLLLASGYQFTPWKDVCLKHCQSPASYFAGRFGPKAIDGVALGIRHGAFCLGCCWFLMLLLFVGGVMNLLWIAAIAAFVLAEKLLPFRFGVPRTAGLVMIAAGLAYPLAMY